MKAIVDATNPPVSGSSKSCAPESRAPAAGLSAEEPAAGPLAGPSARARRNPMQERSQETVQRIFAGAAKLLGRGLALADVTTAMIATEAGVSVGALYRFFPDKQAI